MIKSTANDKNIYKSLMKIVKHLVRRKLHKKGIKFKNKKREFILPTYSASRVSQDQIDRYKQLTNLQKQEHTQKQIKHKLLHIIV